MDLAFSEDGEFLRGWSERQGGGHTFKQGVGGTQ